jgi:iron complex transport system substrate-binding protein
MGRVFSFVHCRVVWLCILSGMPIFASAQNKDVVVIGGALTEIVYLLGAENRIAATDTTSSFPPAAEKTPKVGYQRALNAEGVLSLKPKLILAAGDAGPPAAIAQIRATGVTFESFSNEYSMVRVTENVARIANLLNMNAEGEKLVKRLRAEWDQTRDRVSGYSANKKPRVLFLLAHAGPNPQVAGEDTSASMMIELAGGVNALTGFKGYRPLTAEAAVAAKPDVILVTSQGITAQGGVEMILAKPGLALTPAGQNKRVVGMEALMLLAFGPRLPEAVLALAVQLHK